MELNKNDVEYLVGILKKHTEKINSVALDEPTRTKHLNKTDKIIKTLTTIEHKKPVEKHAPSSQKITLPFDRVLFLANGVCVHTIDSGNREPQIEVPHE